MGAVLEHKHLIIRAEINNPPTCTEAITEWMKTLISDIKMEILMGPYAVYSDMIGNRGLTAVTILSTSHCTVHVWDEVSPALCEIDVYSCSDLNAEDVFKSMKCFEPTKIEYHFIDREDAIHVIDSGEFLVDSIIDL